jgi:hypothetical protein
MPWTRCKESGGGGIGSVGGAPAGDGGGCGRGDWVGGYGGSSTS